MTETTIYPSYGEEETKLPPKRHRRVQLDKVATVAISAALSLLATAGERDAPELTAPAVSVDVGLERVDSTPLLDKVPLPTLSLDARDDPSDVMQAARDGMLAIETDNPDSQARPIDLDKHGNPVNVVLLPIPKVRRRRQS